MRLAILVLLLSSFITGSKAQNCDIATTGVSIVNASNTAPVLGGCIAVTYHFKFSIANLGSDPGCSIPVNTVTAIFDFPTLGAGIKPYIYTGPALFVSGYFTWSYDSFDEVLVGTNTTAIPNGQGDAGILVTVTGNAIGTGSSALNITQGGGTSDNVANNTASAQFTVNTAPVVNDRPDESNCNSGSFTMSQTGTGVWTLVSGSATITTPASPATTVTGVPAGTAATVRWTVTNGSCSVSDDVTVMNNAIPSLSVSNISNNPCHGGSAGSITITATVAPLPYTFTISGPTVNNTGQSSGIFTGLLAGNYTITAKSSNGCINSINATVTEPSGLLPDISLGADFDANFFTALGDESNIVYNVSEVAGNAATGDTIRIVRIPGYSILFDGAATAITIGSSTYTLDNSRWKIDDSSPSFASIIFDPVHNSVPGTLNCGGRVYISLKIKRNTLNISTFSLSARLRKANNESALLNNLNSIVFTAE